MEDPEKKQTSLAVLIIAGIIIVSAVGLRIQQYIKTKNPETVTFVLNNAIFETEVADTPEKLELGLGKRDSLPENSAMYFPFPTAGKWIFWMKDMKFPIDIIWLNEGKVIDVSRDVPVPTAGTTLSKYSPKEPADAVLEINAGIAAEINVKLGDTLRLVY